MSTPSTAPLPAKDTDTPTDSHETYLNFWQLMVRTFHLWNRSDPEADFNPKMFLLLFWFSIKELGRRRELPDPALDEIERTIERLRSPKSLDWILGKARKLKYDRTLMRAIVRTLNTGGSKEQTMRPRTLHARLTTNLRVRSAIYQLAVESGSMEFVEYAYSKNWLMDPFTYARLKLRFRRLEFNSDSELAAM